MLLELSDAALFIALYSTFMVFVNDRLGVIPVKFSTPKEFGSLPLRDRVKVRDAWLTRSDLLEPFIAENPARLSDEQLDIVRSWRHFVAGRFFILRDLKKYTVLLPEAEPTIAYGVIALTQTFSEMIGPTRPYGVWQD